MGVVIVHNESRIESKVDDMFVSARAFPALPFDYCVVKTSRMCSCLPAIDQWLRARSASAPSLFAVKGLLRKCLEYPIGTIDPAEQLRIDRLGENVFELLDFSFNCTCILPFRLQPKSVTA